MPRSKGPPGQIDITGCLSSAQRAFALTAPAAFESCPPLLLACGGACTAAPTWCAAAALVPQWLAASRRWRTALRWCALKQHTHVHAAASSEASRCRAQGRAQGPRDTVQTAGQQGRAAAPQRARGARRPARSAATPAAWESLGKAGLRGAVPVGGSKPARRPAARLHRRAKLRVRLL